MSTSSQNLIHFAINYHRKNIWVLQLNIADSEKNIIVYYAGKELNFSRRVWCEQYEPKKSHTRLKSNFDRLLIIFLITQIHRVRFVSVNREASIVRPSKKNFEKKLENKILRKFWKKNVGKKIWKKNFREKMLEKRFWKKMLKKKCWKKKFGTKILKKKMLEKTFWKKNGKINSKTKIFITKLYSSIDKCHTIFALLASFDKTGQKIGTNENVCGIWFKIGSVAR